MRCPFYQVDAFTGEAFRGNPAAVMVLDTWLPDTTLQAVAAENNLAETAFLVRQADRDYQLRWFTPVVEVPLCGHATLASAFVIMTEIDATADEVCFITASGRLGVHRRGDMYVLDFPAETPVACEPPGDVVAAVGSPPAETMGGSNHLFVYASEAEVRSLEPDMRDLGGSAHGRGQGRDRHGSLFERCRRRRLPVSLPASWNPGRPCHRFGPLHDRSLLGRPPGN